MKNHNHLYLFLGLLGFFFVPLVQADYTFAVVPKRMNSNYWQTVRTGCETRARVLSQTYQTNITCLFTGPVEGGTDAEAKQLAVLEDLLAKHLDGSRPIDGLALSVMEAPSGTEMIDRFWEAGIDTFTFDSDAVDSKRLAYIGTNNFEMGAELGRVLLQVTDNEELEAPTFGIIGAGSPNIAERMRGVRDILTTAGWTEVATSHKICFGDPALAVQQMYEFVNDHPDITAIVPVADWPMMEKEMWMGFVDANPKVWSVVGDISQGQVDLMNMGYAHALVGQLPFEMGKLAMDYLLLVKQSKENGLPIPFQPGQKEIIETNFLNVINIPRDLPPLVYNMNFIGQWRIFGYVLAGIVMVLSIVFACWTFWNRHTRVVKASQPSFLLMICVGCLIMSSTIIPLSVDDEHSSQRGCDIACMSAPWLFSVGFVIAFAALFSKTWRINKVFRNPNNFQRIKVTEKDVLAPFGLLLAANVIVLVCWTIFDPLQWERRATTGTDNWNRVYKSFYGTCVSSSKSKEDGYQGSTVYIVLLITINLIALIIAAVQGYQARHIHVEFSESQYIAFAIVCMLEAFLVGTPILFLLSENPVSSFIVQSILIFFSSAAVLLFSFVPKIVRAKDARKSCDRDLPAPSHCLSQSPGPLLLNGNNDNSAETLTSKPEEEDQLKFRVMRVAQPISHSIRASISFGNVQNEHEVWDDATAPKGTPTALPQGIYRISEKSSSSASTPQCSKKTEPVPLSASVVESVAEV